MPRRGTGINSNIKKRRRTKKKNRRRRTNRPTSRKKSQIRRTANQQANYKQKTYKQQSQELMDKYEQYHSVMRDWYHTIRGGQALSAFVIAKKKFSKGEFFTATIFFVLATSIAGIYGPKMTNTTGFDGSQTARIPVADMNTLLEYHYNGIILPKVRKDTTYVKFIQEQKKNQDNICEKGKKMIKGMCITQGGANKWKEGDLITNGNRYYKVKSAILHRNGDLIYELVRWNGPNESDGAWCEHDIFSTTYERAFHQSYRKVLSGGKRKTRKKYQNAGKKITRKNYKTLEEQAEEQRRQHRIQNNFETLREQRRREILQRRRRLAQQEKEAFINKFRKLSYSQQLAVMNKAKKKYTYLVQRSLRERNPEQRLDLDFQRLQTHSLIQQYHEILDQQRYDSPGDASGFESDHDNASDDESKTGGGTTFTGGHPGIYTKQADDLREMSQTRWQNTPIITPEEQERQKARRQKKGYARQFTPSLKRQTSLNIEGNDAFKGGGKKLSKKYQKLEQEQEQDYNFQERIKKVAKHMSVTPDIIKELFNKKPFIKEDGSVNNELIDESLAEYEKAIQQQQGGMMKSSNNNNNYNNAPWDIRANWGQGNRPQPTIFKTWNEFLTYLRNKKEQGEDDYVIEKTYIYYKKGHRDEGVYNKPHTFRQYVKFKNIITNELNWEGPLFSVVRIEKITDVTERGEEWKPEEEDKNWKDIHVAEWQVSEEDIVIKENEGQANEMGVGHLPWKIGEKADNWFVFNQEGNQNYDNHSRAQRLPQDNSEVNRMTENIQTDNQHDQPPQQAQQGGKKSKKVKEMIKIFQKHPDVFPSGYFRFLGARLENHLKKKTIIFKDGVILTWIEYQKTVKKSEECIYKPGDVKLDQIVNKNPGNGKAKKIMLKFLKDNKDSTVWLEVKKDNIRARDFYEKNGFQEVCSTKFGDIKGIIMKKDP